MLFALLVVLAGVPVSGRVVDAESRNPIAGAHVVLIPEELAVARVAYRVHAGGHPVAENKIRERYHRLWTLVADAIPRCEQATVYDNSGLKGPRIVAQMSDGFIVGSPAWPDWTPQALQSRWPTR